MIDWRTLSPAVSSRLRLVAVIFAVLLADVFLLGFTAGR